MKQSIFNHITPISDGGFGLYSFFSGKFTFLNFLSKDIYDHPELYPASHPQIQRFLRDGFLVDYDELAYLRNLVQLDCGRAAVVRLSICPTLSCNFACPYCYETKRGGVMSREVQDNVVEFARHLIRFNNARQLQVIWYGGEPLLCPDIIRSLSSRLMALCEEKGIYYNAGIITNGYGLDAAASAMFDECKIMTAQITIDGPDAATHDRTRYLRNGSGSFDRIMENLRNFKGNCHIDIRCNVQKDNIAAYPALEEKLTALAKETGLDLSVYAARMQSFDACGDIELPFEEYLSFFKQNMKEIPRICFRGPVCTVPRSSDFIVDERGNLIKCLRSAGVDEDIIGNVADFDITRPNTGNMDNLTKCLDSVWPGDDEECLSCPVLPCCLGGCPQDRMKSEKHCRGVRFVLDEYVAALGKELRAHDGK